MKEMIITSSVLILLIFILRRLIGEKISMRFRYALWLVAAVRLMVPVNVGSSSFSVLNLVPDVWQERDAGDTMTAYHGGTIVADEMSDAGYADHGGNHMLPAGTTDLGEEQEAVPASDVALGSDAVPASEVVPDGIAGQVKESRSGNDVLVVIWLAGILLAGGYMTIMQTRFVRYLYRNREAVSLQCVPGEWTKRLKANGMKLYQVKGLSSPCLAGRNIYISTKLCEETDRLPHILAHEYCHARQHDTLWALLRSVLTAVYWFHPCVWAAAYAAKQDSELACDEAAIRLLGEANRYEYGRTLLYLLQGGSNKIGYAGMILTMDGKKRGIRERVSMIAGKHDRKGWAAAAAVVMMCVFCGCAFTGAKGAGQGAGQPEDNRTAGETGSKIQTEDLSSKEEEIKRLAEEKATLEKEDEQLAEASGEMEEKFSEEKKPEMTESSAEEQRLAQLKAEAEQDAAFQKIFYETDARTIMLNKGIDQQAYSKYYLGVTQDCPLENGTWYILHNDASGISLYGLYTEKYGCYGLATLIGEDMNFFLEEWLPGYMMRCITVLEWAQDGMPRTFAFRIRNVNTGVSEVWKLYVADRYDTGHIELYSFSEYDYRKQFEDKMNFSVQQDSGQIMVIWEEDMVVGEIDVSAFENQMIEDVVWDGDIVNFRLDDADKAEGGTDSEQKGAEENGNTKEQISLMTGVGLKLKGREEAWYHGLPVLSIPIDVGEWGEHEFMLGVPTIETAQTIFRPQTALPDVEEKIGSVPIHLNETEN